MTTEEDYPTELEWAIKAYENWVGVADAYHQEWKIACKDRDGAKKEMNRLYKEQERKMK